MAALVWRLKVRTAEVRVRTAEVWVVRVVEVLVEVEEVICYSQLLAEALVRVEVEEEEAVLRWVIHWVVVLETVEKAVFDN